MLLCCRAAPDAKLNEIKALLGKMLFSGAGMEKRVGGGGLDQAGGWDSSGGTLLWAGNMAPQLPLHPSDISAHEGVSHMHVASMHRQTFTACLALSNFAG